MERPITFPATLVSARRHVDKSVSWTHRSNFEMSTEDFAEIDRHLGDTGYACWSSNEVQLSDLPVKSAPEASGRMTPSQEMRWNLRLIFDKLQPEGVEFDDFYKAQMRTYNAHLRAKADSLP